MDFLSKISRNGSVVTEIGMIECMGSPNTASTGKTGAMRRILKACIGITMGKPIETELGEVMPSIILISVTTEPLLKKLDKKSIANQRFLTIPALLTA